MLRRQVRDLDAAVDAFREAAQLDAAYLERAYYHRDFAAALFNNNEFDNAAEHYERAIGLGSEDLTVALHADALLFSGEYEASLQGFDDYLRSTPGDEDAPWRLKTRVLRHIVEIVGPRQDRDPEGAAKPLASWDFENGPDLSIEEAWQRCSEAVSLDACCGEAWFRLGLLAIPSSASSPSAGGMHSLAGAVLRGGGEAAWTNALLCVEPGDDDLVADLCEVAYHSCGDSFVQKATASVKGAEHLQGKRGDILKALDEAVVRVDAARLRRGFTMRFRRDDGGMDELVFGAPEESSVSQEVEVAKRPTWRPASAKPLKPRHKRAPKTYGKQKGKKKRKR
jgi:tetratricopeptide (TPR) repeat protein